MSITGVTSSNLWYKVDQAWNQSRQAISNQFLNESSILNSALSDAMNNQNSGMATLAANAALSRIKGKTNTASQTTSSASTIASSATSQSAVGSRVSAIGNNSSSANTSGSKSPYAYTAAANILSNSNIVSFFA